MAESTQGAFDGVIRHGISDYSGISGNTNHFNNYTRITELYGNEYNLSPRCQFNPVTVSSTNITTD